MNYDPEDGPRRAVWLAADEDSRLSAVRAYHKGGGLSEEQARVHSAIHVVVENQLADGPNPTTAALDRLILEGLSRHDAIHAIGSVVADQLFAMIKERKPYDAETHARKLDALSATTWRKAPDRG